LFERVLELLHNRRALRYHAPLVLAQKPKLTAPFTLLNELLEPLMGLRKTERQDQRVPAVVLGTAHRPGFAPLVREFRVYRVHGEPGQRQHFDH